MTNEEIIAGLGKDEVAFRAVGIWGHKESCFDCVYWTGARCTAELYESYCRKAFDEWLKQEAG